MYLFFTQFQAESPSSNQLSALSIYLLTCLFFVGCAILEFAYLLQRRRIAERRYDYQKIKQFQTKGKIFEDHELKKDESGKENWDECNVFERRRLPSKEWDGRNVEKQKFWFKSNIIDFKCCTLDIDILSQWTFFLTFVIFNVCYWCLYLKLLPMTSIIQ